MSKQNNLIFSLVVQNNTKLDLFSPNVQIVIDSLLKPILNLKNPPKN
jgi:hypothetical protein